MSDNILFIVLLVFAILASVIVCGGFVTLMLPWLRAFMSGAPVSMLHIVGMRIRGNPPGLMVDTLAALKHRGVDATMHIVESTYLAHKGQPFTPAELADLVEQRLQGDTSR